MISVSDEAASARHTNWTTTSTWRTASGASTAARCDTRPVYCSAEDTAGLLRQGKKLGCVVGETLQRPLMVHLLLLANVVSGYKQ